MRLRYLLVPLLSFAFLTACDQAAPPDQDAMRAEETAPAGEAEATLPVVEEEVSAAPTGEEPAAPFHDAAFYWSMSGGNDLAVEGEVALGVELAGDERAASLARGGDGKVARFDGGHLALADDAGLVINPQQWTIAIRMRDPQGAWQHPILGSYGDDKTVSVALRGVDLASKPMSNNRRPTVESWFAAADGPRSVPGTSLIEAVWGAREPDAPRVERIRRAVTRLKIEESFPLKQDTLNAVMRVNFPTGLIGPTDWHDIVLAMTGAKLELWIDGVLVDEEYPIGETRPRSLPFLIGAGHENGELKTGFRGLVDHVAVWNRPLSPEEITALSGGRERVRQRELAILGDESPSMQYFRARGHNRKVGDCIPYWDERAETFRLFYLILRRNMHSKWDGGHGGLEIWQASTKDLKTWTHHPVTIPITEQWEAWNGTGAVVFHDGQYNWFYPTPHYEGEHDGVQRAVSKDGVTFTKVPPHPFMEGGDVEIFEPGDGLFHLIKRGPQQHAKNEPLGNKTLVAWVRCADLDQRGGGVLTIEHPDAEQFDGIVFGEVAPRRWMPGSNRRLRTPRDQSAWAAETSTPDDIVQVAIVYDGEKGMLYRNGTLYASYPINAPLVFPTGSSLLMGRRHTAAPADDSHFKGRILDARVYDTALEPGQIAALEPDTAGGPQPVAWYDFEAGSLSDRTGTFPDAMLRGGARIENGELVLSGAAHLKVPGTVNTQVRLTSPDLDNWTEQPGAFIASDRGLAICPNVFQFGDWHYYMCARGVWKSRGWFGPWTEHTPLQLDNLMVPKTGAFGKDRRIYAAYLGDDGWGGNIVLRELVQDSDGNLGTRFVNEMIPATAEPLSIQEEVRVQGGGERAVFDLAGIPRDYRLQMEVVPGPGASVFGVSLSAGEAGGCDLMFDPGAKRVRFSAMSGSSGNIYGGPAVEAVEGLDKPFAVDIIVSYDILDVEIAGRRSIVTRFWNPAGDRLRFFAEGGAVTFRNIRVSPLKEAYKPYPVSPSPGKALQMPGPVHVPGVRADRYLPLEQPAGLFPGRAGREVAG